MSAPRRRAGDSQLPYATRAARAAARIAWRHPRGAAVVAVALVVCARADVRVAVLAVVAAIACASALSWPYALRLAVRVGAVTPPVEHEWRRWCRQAAVPVVPDVIRVEQIATGQKLTVRMPAGTPFALLRRYDTAIGSAAGCPVRIVEDDAHPGRGWATIVRRTSREITPGPSPLVRVEPGTISVHDGVPWGVDADGRPVTLELWESSALVCGKPGSGKSVGMSQVVATAALASDGELWAIDAKAGVELAPWEHCCARFADTPAGGRRLLVECADTMDARLRQMKRDGIRKWVPSPATPLIVLVVDELAELDDVALATLRRVMALGRAAGIATFAATQRPSADLIPTSLRTLFRFAVAFASRSSTDSDVCLGVGAAKEGWDASKLTRKGLCWIRGESDNGARLARTHNLTDAQISAIARRCPPVQAPQSDSDTPPAAGDTRNTPGSRAPDASATRVAVAVASLAARAIGPAAGGRRDVRLEASDRRILDALARVGRASAGELAAALGGKPAKRTIERRFKVLAAARMVRSVPDGRTVRWELA